MSKVEPTPLRAGRPEQRRIVHRGRPRTERFHFERTDLRQVETFLPAGKSIAASVADFMQSEKCTSGIVELSGGLVKPFNFVIPAEDPAKQHAVWYSDTRSVPDGVAIHRVSCSVGLHNGAPFLHCHGLWRTPAGEIIGGHILPDDNEIVEPVSARAILATGASFERRLDGETAFELFAAVGGSKGRGVIATARPNEDITSSIENVARAAGIRKARIHGVGSLIDMTFADGRVSRSLAHEVAITGGEIVPDGKDVRAVDLAVAGVGMNGLPSEGPLKRGCNPVCVTFELALYPHDE